MQPDNSGERSMNFGDRRDSESTGFHPAPSKQVCGEFRHSSGRSWSGVRSASPGAASSTAWSSNTTSGVPLSPIAFSLRSTAGCEERWPLSSCCWRGDAEFTTKGFSANPTCADKHYNVRLRTCIGAQRGICPPTECELLRSILGKLHRDTTEAVPLWSDQSL